MTTRTAVEQLANLARTDDTRPVYAASRPLATDICADLLDIAAVTVDVRDTREFRSQLESWQEMHPDKPVVAVGFGSQVQHENRHGYTDPLSQEAQARFFLQRFDALKAIDPATTRSEGYAFLTELILRCADHDLRVEEVPISFVDRAYGQSKMSARIIAESMLRVTAWGTTRRWRRARTR